MKTIRKLYEAVVNWNYRCGNKPVQVVDDRFWITTGNQMQRIIEEAKETQEAVVAGNALEFLDGVCDLFVVTSYLMEQAVAAGFDVEGALKAVCDNNDTKYSTDVEVAQAGAMTHTASGTPCIVKATSVGGITYYSIVRKSDGKIMKPVDFQSVDLRKYLPNGLHNV